MMPSAMIQPRLARSASIPEPRPRGGGISEALVIAVPFHVSMLMRDPAQKVITRQGVTIDLDQTGPTVVECGIETALVRVTRRVLPSLISNPPNRSWPIGAGCTV